MTVSEVLREVSALGFDGIIECDDVFMTALERGKRQLFAEMGVTESVLIPPVEYPPESTVAVYRHRSGTRASFPLVGVSYSFYVSGIGEYTVVDKDGEAKRSFNTPRSRIAGFISGGGSIIFEGKYAFTVTDLICHSSLYGDKLSDIPDISAIRRVDMRRLVADFRAFAAPARDERGRTVTDVRLEEPYVLIPSECKRQISILYYRTPRQSYPEQPDDEVDVPYGCEHLLSTLVASYVYIDSYPDRAAIYLEAYKDAIASAKKNRVRSLDNRYRVTDRWA